jgi:transcriptional regulator with PAS, ATPase and Fis domain
VKIKILGIAPYTGLKDLMTEQAKHVPNLDIHIEFGDLQEGVDLALSAEEQGYDVIISRGGTASMIRDVVKIPVIDIKVTGYDMLRMLTLLDDYKGGIAIVGFSNITHGATTICSLLDMNIETFTITHESEVREKLIEVQNKNIEVVIGDVVAVKMAEELGLNGMLITSGKEAVLEAFEEAKQIYQSLSTLKKEAMHYKEILQNDNRAIIMFNNNKEIVYSNYLFQKWFEPFLSNGDQLYRSTSQDLWKEMISIVEDAWVNKKIPHRFIHNNDDVWNVNAVSNDGFVILYIRHVQFHQSMDKQSISLKFKTNSQNFSFAHISGTSKLIRNEVEKAKAYSKLNTPILIRGEAGTGKESFATSIHQLSQRRNEPFIQIDCNLIDIDEWQKFFSNDQQLSLFSDEVKFGTIYIKNIEKMPYTIQTLFFSYLNDENKSNLMKTKLIVSSNDKILQKVQQNSFIEDLFYYLSRTQINLPPLRERPEDIKDLCRLFIAEFNSFYGKQIVGVREDVLELFKQLKWQGNIKQLRNVIEESILLTTGSYIEKSEISSILERLQKDEETKHNNIVLQGTLQEIEEQIILKVLEEEGMNKAKAAARLGINRSTLWRKMNQVNSSLNNLEND